MTEIRRDDRYASSAKYASMLGIYRDAKRKLPETSWTYLQCGTSDEVTARANISAFDELEWDLPQFAGVERPDTRTRVLGHDLAFPAFTAPFGGGETLLDPEGMKAVGRAAKSCGIKQMVPVAAYHSAEEIREASDVAVMFQMTFCGDESAVVEMMHRLKDAGYSQIIATYSPIRQWRERMMEDRFTSPGGGAQSNFGPGKSDVRMLEELLDFPRKRWTWDQAQSAISKCPLPVIVKGVGGRRDARAALDAGAAGLYVSNYGGRSIDRQPAAIKTLPEIRDEAGPEVPILFDSGIRRGSDIAAALALGANAVALGRAAALGLAADGEAGVRRVLELLKDEFWTTMGHLGCSTVPELTPAVFRKAP